MPGKTKASARGAFGCRRISGPDAARRNQVVRGNVMRRKHLARGHFRFRAPRKPQKRQDAKEQADISIPDGPKGRGRPGNRPVRPSRALAGRHTNGGGDGHRRFSQEAARKGTERPERGEADGGLVVLAAWMPAAARSARVPGQGAATGGGGLAGHPEDKPDAPASSTPGAPKAGESLETGLCARLALRPGGPQTEAGTDAGASARKGTGRPERGETTRERQKAGA